MTNRDWLYVVLGILAVIVTLGMFYVAFRPRTVYSWFHSRKHAKDIDNDLDELFNKR